MQLLNPSFSNGVRVYFDPFAKETLSAGIAGIKVAGGIAKSYYFKKGDDVAYRIKKKNYDEEFSHIFSDCKSLVKKYTKKPKWSDLEKHIIEFNKCK